MKMHHLFSPEGEAALAALLQQRPLLAFDFDGTLTPIVARPGDARLAPGVSARLAALAALLPVAIVSGRSVEDVRGRLGFVPQFIVGNHGAEEAGPPAAATGHAGALSPLRARLIEARSALAAAGVTVEDKGHSVALHYRLSRHRELAQRVIGEVLAGLDETLRVFGGKLVVNVVARLAPDKADAVRALVQRCGAQAALFVGDDVNDEPVFASAPPHWLTVRVGRDDPRSKARWFLDSQREVALLLERLLTLLASP
ncbi:MAG: trehalose-phosphatase [Rubrivivax sp.]|nr:trehalose-phosphatase [Rubrivivax sp.]